MYQNIERAEAYESSLLDEVTNDQEHILIGEWWSIKARGPTLERGYLIVPLTVTYRTNQP